MGVRKLQKVENLGETFRENDLKNTLKTRLNGHLGEFLIVKEGSNPSDSTSNTLTLTDFTKSGESGGAKNETQKVKGRWTDPVVYEPPGRVSDGKKWFVRFYYQHPVTGKYELFRYGSGFADLDTKKLRRQHGRALVRTLRELLKDGWSPFEEFKEEKAKNEDRVVHCIDMYLSSVKPNLRPNTYKKYLNELTLFKKWLMSSGLGNLRMKDVRKAVVTEFLTKHNEERQWSGKTYNLYLNDITTFFNYFADNFDDIIEKAPSASLKRVAVEKPGNLAYTDWQFKELKDLMLADGDYLLYYYCSFVYYAGLRNEAECTYIKAGDFNFNTKTLRIDSGTAKNRQTEYIPLYPEFIDFLREIKVDQMNSDYYVFGKKTHLEAGLGYPQHTGQDFFARKFRKYKKMLNLSDRHGIYCYKHTRAVHLGEDGEDLYKIMKLFRHKDLATTMIYMRGLGINVQNTEYKRGRRF